MIFLKLTSALEKCFMDESPADHPELVRASALLGEEFAFEALYGTDETAVFPKRVVSLRVETSDPALADRITVRRIEQVPVRVPCYRNADDNYVRKTPGFYPDLLAPAHPDELFVTGGELKALWVTVWVPETLAGGDYPIRLSLWEGETELAADEMTLHVIPEVLPEQSMTVTEWFHTDCIANYYELETFSETHWEYIGNFMKTAVKNGINTILMPVFTPPLDTAVGGERRTTQLVDVTKTADGWEFGFDKVERWVEVAKAAGVKNYEVSHLYTQWGCAHAPKIMGTDENGTYRRLFGWETDALSDEYRTFLRAFLTAFLAKMDALGVGKNCLFHISDEPSIDHLEAYMKAKAQISDLIEGHTVMDALSNFAFYQTGALDHPIPASNHITPFLDADVPNLWTYYCCGQGVDVSNRFVAMPMARTRVIGMQFWKYKIAGFLQWGYNFYNSQGSTHEINPFLITDGDYFTPAGDCFSVYPGKNGEPYETMHLKGFTMALTDRRALDLAEKKAGREAVLRVLEEAGEVTFAQYPHSAEWLLSVRERINAIIEDN